MVVAGAIGFWCFEAAAGVIRGTCSGFSAKLVRHATFNIHFYIKNTFYGRVLRKHIKNSFARREKIEKRKKTEIKIKINFHALFAIEKLKEKRNVSDGGGTKTTFFAH